MNIRSSLRKQVHTASNAAALPALSIAREIVTSFEGASSREWLVTNGLGGYASGTVAGLNTRRYHGLLVASLRPPVERTLMVAKVDAIITYRGQRYELATNEFADGTIAPQGYKLLESFRLEGTMPVWTWAFDDAHIEQRIWMAHGANTTYVQFTVLDASEPVTFDLTPLCTYRDYHAQHRGYRETLVTPVEGGVQIDAFWGAHPYRVLAERGEVRVAPDWYWNFKHRAESERGLDDVEDLFRPALVSITLSQGETSAVVLTAEADAPLRSGPALQIERARQLAVLKQAKTSASEWTAQLVLAADQFIVCRDAEMGSPGATVIAGYPWFGDWGRDTMIALPGLTLSSHRYAIAANVLRTFGKYVSEGMLPNRFPDGGEVPEYNTVDATLWYFIAVDEYVRATGDQNFVREIYPVLQSIVDWHIRGTRYGIRVDETDGLLRAGAPGVQLTWMDAKIGDWVVTPRTGKAVEINALWVNALTIMHSFASALGERSHEQTYAARAAKAKQSFNARFWFEAGGYLYDVIDSPQGNDSSLRPNQLIALSLRHSLLTGDRAKSVVDICGRELWTPIGMRSLGRKQLDGTAHPHYAPIYSGGPQQRDAIYHQGVSWSWLLGPFALAHYRIYRNRELALSYLTGIKAHLSEGCIGQVTEIADAESPFTPRGCFAQAWGVAEVLRAWNEINEH